ncbi:DciA family protein [Paraburkholderia sp. SIMBA_049]
MSRFSPFSRQSLKPGPKLGSKSFGVRRPQAVVEVLNRTDAFAALRAGVEQVAALERDLAELLPDYLATSVEPGFIKDGVLALFAAHNALAARLRHMEPRLLSDLQQRGWPVNALKIRVRPQSVKEPPRVKQARMSRAGADALHELSETLEPSPLREALARMAARHRK